MRISCTNCEANYEVDDALIPATGREVKCSQCEKVWLALPVVEVAVESQAEIEAQEQAKKEALWAEKRAAKIQAREEKARKSAENELKEQVESEASIPENISDELAQDPPKEAQETTDIQADDSANEANVTGDDSKVVQKGRLLPATSINPNKLSSISRTIQKNEARIDRDGKNDHLKSVFQKQPMPESEEATVSKAVEELSKRATNNAERAEVIRERKSVLDRSATKAKPAESKPIQKAKPVKTVKAASEKAEKVEPTKEVAAKAATETAAQATKTKSGQANETDDNVPKSKSTPSGVPSKASIGDDKFLKREPKIALIADQDPSPEAASIIDENHEITAIPLDVENVPASQSETRTNAVAESKFWQGFAFVVCLVLLLIVFRLLSGPISNALPATAPYLSLFNLWFDSGLAYIVSWFSTLKEMF